MITAKGLKKLILHPKTFIKDYRNKGKAASFDLNNTNLLIPFTHLLHTGESGNGFVHLDLWIPWFLRADIDFIVLVRSPILLKEIKIKYPRVEIVYARGAKDVENIIDRLSALKACFYPSNTGNNLHLLKFNDIKHIFIGHGDSDKTASAHKYFRVYDENWVASDAHIDRFQNEGFDFSGLKSVKVGRPNLLKILGNSTDIWHKRFGGKLQFLYLSTWEGFTAEQDYTSVYFFKEILELLKELENIKLSVKLHPRVGSRDLSLLKTNDKVKEYTQKHNISCSVYEAEKPVDELIIESNIFICDISAVVSECLASNAPIFVYIPKDKEIKLSKSNMKFEDYTYTFSSILELSEKLTIVLNGNDYLKENREKAMEYILGKTSTLEEKFVYELNSIANRKEVLSC